MGRRERLTLLALALVVAALAYVGALGAALVWDDHHLLGPQGSVVRVEHWTQLFTSRFWDAGSVAATAEEYYRPLTLASFRPQQRRAMIAVTSGVTGPRRPAYPSYPLVATYLSSSSPRAVGLDFPLLLGIRAPRA